jgi:mRNA interferase MazF
MARFVGGDVVVVPFPFTDLSSAKIRPALVLTVLTRGDIILCQITSQAAGHPEAVPILLSDFQAGGLPRASFALPHRVVTANEACVLRTVGRLNHEKLSELRDHICAIIKRA